MQFSSDEDYKENQVPEKPEFDFSSDKDHGPPLKDPNLNAAKNLGKGDSLMLGAGHGLTQIKRALEEGWLKLSDLIPGVDNATKLSDLEKVYTNEQDTYKRITSKHNPNAGYVKGGKFGAEVGAGMAVPTPQSKTMMARALWNALNGGLYEGLTTTGGIGNRAGAAAMGGLGSGTGSLGVDLLTKGTGSALGKFTQPEAIARRDAMVREGFKPRIGDIADLDTATMMKSGENLLADVPIGATKFSDDIKLMREKIVPNRVSGKNVVVDSIKEIDKAVRDLSDQIWEPFNTFMKNNSVPGVRPTDLKTAIADLLVHDKGFLKGIPGDPIRTKLEMIHNTPLNKLRSIPLDEYHEMMKAIGSLTPSVKAVSTPAPGSSRIADKAAYRKFAALLDAINNDAKRLSTLRDPNAQEAYRLFDQSRKTWEEKVLPWKSSDVVYKLKESGKAATDTANIVSKADPYDAMKVRDYLKQYGPYDSSDLFDTLIGMNRQGKALAGDSNLMSSLDVTRGVLSSPAALMSRNKTFQNMYFGDPGLDSGVAEIIRRLGIGSGRETGEETTIGLAALWDLFGGGEESDINSDDPQYSHGMGAASQMGAAGR